MKLLHVVPSYLPGHRYGGPIASVHGLSSALAQRGHEVEVWTTDRDDGERLPVAAGEQRHLDGVLVRYFRVHGPARLRYAPGLARALAAEGRRFDWIHAHGLFQWTSHAALSAARRLDRPAALSPRGMLQSEVLELRGARRKRAWLSLIERENLRSLAALHLTSTLEQRTLPDLGFPWPDPWLIPNGVALPAETPAACAELPAGLAMRRASQEPLLLFLGRLSWKKGLDRLVELLPRLPAGHLVVAGPDDGYQRQFEQGLERAGVRERVSLLGPVRGAQKAALLAACDLLVLPSRSENFANVVLEGLAAGLPALVTPEVGAAELLSAWDAGWVEPIASWAEALPRLLQDPERLLRTGERGRRAVRAEATWPAIAARFEAAYADGVPLAASDRSAA